MSGPQEDLVNEMLLDGHLGITKELLLFQNSAKKHFIGCDPAGSQLINDLVEYFIFPASYLFKKYRDSLMSPGNLGQTSALNNFEQLLANKSLKSICNSSMTTNSAFDLLVSLCTGCLPNLQTMSDLLLQLFYPSLLSKSINIPSSASTHNMKQSAYLQEGTGPNNNSLNQLANDCTIAQNEWEYMPPIGQRPHNGFVGLKNAGATCYMNSVLQQLFMIKNIRNFILNVETPLSLIGAIQQQNSSGLNANLNNSTINDCSKDTTTNLFDDLDETDSIMPNLSGIRVDSNEADLSKSFRSSENNPSRDTDSVENKVLSEEDIRKE